MNAMTTRRRFCTCSGIPSQLKKSSLDGGTSYPVSYVDIRSASTASDPSESASSGEVPFCTCSEVPGHILNRTDGDLTVKDVSGAPEEISADADRRPKVASAETQQAVPNPGSDAKSGERIEPELNSVSDLFPGEATVVSVSTHGKGGSEVVLTDRRVLLRGAAEAKVLHASMPMSEIGSLTISRARPSKRSLIWGLIGIGAAIGMWQALDAVGNLRLIVSAIVILVSGLLLADYFLRPPDLQMVFRSHSGAEMAIEFGQSQADEADRFAAQVLAKLESSSPD